VFTIGERFFEENHGCDKEVTTPAAESDRDAVAKRLNLSGKRRNKIAAITARLAIAIITVG
jgi:hypothetical protein